MQATLRRMREERAGTDRGFTLIELLVVVVIIGVLVAIAIPVYLNYRKGAENKSAQSDVRNAVSAVEQFYTENSNAYPPDTSGTGPGRVTFHVVGGTDETATLSDKNTLNYHNAGSSYWICAENSDGGTVYVYNSSNGTGVNKTASSLASCTTNGS